MCTINSNESLYQLYVILATREMSFLENLNFPTCQALLGAQSTIHYENTKIFLLADS